MARARREPELDQAAPMGYIRHILLNRRSEPGSISTDDGLDEIFGRTRGRTRCAKFTGEHLFWS